VYFKLNPAMESVQHNSDFRKQPQTQNFWAVVSKVCFYEIRCSL